MSTPLGIRWTIGDVSERGFEALRLSVHGAGRVFGTECASVVYVNTLPLDTAKRRTGPVPSFVEWRCAERGLPEVLRGRIDSGMAQGVAWKFAPLKAFPDRAELALDNDVILWAKPAALRQWLECDPGARVIAEDVAAGHGAFGSLCGPLPRNSGTRGVPPDFDLEEALRRVFVLVPENLQSELDEQGLQVAALSLDSPPLVVPTEKVTICSPFWPHQEHLGRCGAHFVGLNARHLPWRYYDRDATDVRIEHWER